LARSPAALRGAVEQCWALVGRRRGRVWLCRRVRRSSGDRASVRFDGAWVLKREEDRGDVVGFLHTHPDGPPTPSQRDLRTMRAWCSAFGKPLLCLIACPGGVRGYRFDGEPSARPLELVEIFPGGAVIGVDADG
jgi:proteasome lid subunit RPN8/RPN11